MPRVLIVAFGNPMRCDDGLAWHVADQLEGRYSTEEVEILRAHSRQIWQKPSATAKP